MDVDLDGTIFRLTRRWGELVCEFAGRAAVDGVPRAGGVRQPRSVLIEIDARAEAEARNDRLRAVVESLTTHETSLGIIRIQFIGGTAAAVGSAQESVERIEGLDQATWEWWVSAPDGIDGVDERISLVVDAWRGALLSSGSWEAVLASGQIAAVAIRDTAEEVDRAIAMLERGQDVAVKLRPTRVGEAGVAGAGMSRLAQYVSGDLMGWQPWDELFDRILCEARRPLRVEVGLDAVRVMGAPTYMQDGWGAAEVVADEAGGGCTACAECRFEELGCARIGYSLAARLRRNGAAHDAKAADRWFCKAKTTVHVQLAYIMSDHLREQDRIDRVMVEFGGKGMPLRFSR